MNKTNAITCLFLDIGGVLLTDGWDHNARKRAAAKFNLEVPELEGRHHLILSMASHYFCRLLRDQVFVVFIKRVSSQPSHRWHLSG